MKTTTQPTGGAESDPEAQAVPFTPGPWKVKRMSEGSGQVFVQAQSYEGHPYHGVTTGGIEIMSDDDYPTKEGDAKLIAAAPELLEALQALIADIDAGRMLTANSTVKAREAISKATQPA